MRVMFMMNIPAPYRVAFFNELGKHCELTVLFEKKTANDRDNSWKEYRFENFTGVFLKGISICSDKAFCPGIIRFLLRRKYDIIISANRSTPTGFFAILVMRLFHITFYTEGDGAFIHKDSFFKKSIKRFLVTGASAYFTTGKEYEQSLIISGADPARFVRYPFSSLYEKDIIENVVSRHQKDLLREELNIQETRVVLSVGRFVYGKGFDILIKAAKQIPSSVGVYIIGGKPTTEYIQLVNDNRLKNIHFIDFKDKETLKKYYMCSDLFVFPTRGDTWGLVINEALSNGLPVISSDRCLAAQELVDEGANGFIFHNEDIEQLSNYLNMLLTDDLMRERFAIKSLEKIRPFTIENMVHVHMKWFNTFMSKKEEYND